MEHYRTFIALEIKEEMKRSLASIQQKIEKLTGGIKWVKPKNMHLTLKFLGATRKDKIAVISEMLEKTAAEVKSFNVSVSGLGTFPGISNPKVIWAGLKADDVLIKLQKDIVLSLVSLGFPIDKRPFSPHLTLGRVRDRAVKKKLREALVTIRTDAIDRFGADRITFYRSDLLPEGPVYSELKNIQLSK